MPSSPYTALDRDPFMDLLFSPRAAFIWDNSRKAIAWMNTAARSKFGIGLVDLPGALPAALAGRLAQCFDAIREGAKPRRAIRLKLAPNASCDFSLEPLELAGGQSGLIVSEIVKAVAEGEDAPQAQPKRKPALKGAPKVRRSAKKIRKDLNGKPRPVPQLTAEEFRSFKAIGRKVRRLCREKQRGLASSQVLSEPPAKPLQATVCEAPTLLFSAFDLVLFLDADLCVLRVEGRAQTFGWSKPALMRKPAAHLLTPREQTIFGRMVKKLEAGQLQLCRDTLLIEGDSSGVPCRAILGRWIEGDGAFFLALLSLKLPYRLKKSHSQELSSHQGQRLAA